MFMPIYGQKAIYGHIRMRSSGFGLPYNSIGSQQLRLSGHQSIPLAQI